LENQKPIVARMTLKSLLEKLSPNDFVRSHRSYIVPIKRIVQIKNKNIYLTHDDKMIELPIGKSYEDDVAKFF
jgi:DNA-binding LytR/AlgR family response regulator